MDTEYVIETVQNATNSLNMVLTDNLGFLTNLMILDLIIRFGG
jgi:hypothetical protein